MAKRDLQLTLRKIRDDITANAPQTTASYVALARATLGRAVTDGRIVPLRAMRWCTYTKNMANCC